MSTSEEQEFAKAWADALPILPSLADVATWAEHNGGELGVRVALAENRFEADRAVVERWLELEERKRVLAHEEAALSASQRSAEAAERAARWAMWSAIVSALTAIAAAVWTVVGMRVTAWLSGP